MEWEVWAYGNGEKGRTRLKAENERQAARTFLDRQVVSDRGSIRFRDALLKQDRTRIKICVKDPAQTGTQEDPNYPSVLTFRHGPQGWEADQ